jgi:hypothetical protein
MSKVSLVGLGVALLFGLLLVGCTAPPEITPAAPPPTPAVVVGENGTGNGEANQTQNALSRFPMPPVAQGEPVQVNSDNCIACHTDQAALQELAVEPPEDESLSEGEG